MSEIQEIDQDVFVENQHLVDEHYSSVITNYHEDWQDDCTNNAYYNLSQPEGIRKSHALTLSMFGGIVSETDLFKLAQRSAWKIRCFVFADNEKLKQWLQNVGENNCIHHVYV